MAPRSYDETKLGPMLLPERWWFTLSSARRARIREAADVPATPTHLYIGAIQDKLIAAGKGQLASRFMRAMQEAHDADEAKAKEEVVAEIRRSLEIDAISREADEHLVRSFGGADFGPMHAARVPGQPE